MSSLRRSLMVVVCIGLGGLGVAQAATKMQQPFFQHWLERVQATKQELHLTPTQDVAWQRAMSASEQVYQTNQPHWQQLKQDADRLLSQPKTSSQELRQFFVQMDDQREQALKQRQQVREQWLAVYEQLDEQQQQQIRATLQQQISRWSHRRAFMGEQ